MTSENGNGDGDGDSNDHSGGDRDAGLLLGGCGLDFRENAEEVAAEEFFHLLGGVAAGH